MFEPPAATAVAPRALKSFQEQSFPATSSAPLKWRSRSTQLSGNAAQATTSQPTVEDAQVQPASMMVDGEVRPVAFTLDVSQAKATTNPPRIRTIATGGMRSVLTNKNENEAVAGTTNSSGEPTPLQPAEQAIDPKQSALQDPFGDRLPSARIPYTAKSPNTVPTQTSRGGDFPAPTNELPAPKNNSVIPRPNLSPKPTPAETTPEATTNALPENNLPANESPQLNSPFPESTPLTPKTDPATEPQADPMTLEPKPTDDPLSPPVRAPRLTDDPDADEPPPAAPKSLTNPRLPADEPDMPPSSQPPRSLIEESEEGAMERETEAEKDQTKSDEDAKSRIYNSRDCNEDDARCLKLSNRIRRDSIQQFNKARLDISPAYDPDADTPEEIAESKKAQAEKFARSGNREWKDRSGSVVATGQLIDLRNRAAIIKTEDGQETAISVSRLGTDEVCFVAAWYNLPQECSLRQEPFARRDFACSTFTWKASSLCHKPLYFEQVQLERYGHTAGPVLQPVISGAHFFANIAVLPYKMGINPPNECQYALGYYRPGSCAPWMIPPIPLSVRGGLAQAGSVVGAAAVLP
jgi:hypothetical protein